MKYKEIMQRVKAEAERVDAVAAIADKETEGECFIDFIMRSFYSDNDIRTPFCKRQEDIERYKRLLDPIKQGAIPDRLVYDEAEINRHLPEGKIYLSVGLPETRFDYAQLLEYLKRFGYESKFCFLLGDIEKFDFSPDVGVYTIGKEDYTNFRLLGQGAVKGRMAIIRRFPIELSVWGVINQLGTFERNEESLLRKALMLNRKNQKMEGMEENSKKLIKRIIGAVKSHEIGHHKTSGLEIKTSSREPELMSLIHSINESLADSVEGRLDNGLYIGLLNHINNLPYSEKIAALSWEIRAHHLNYPRIVERELIPAYISLLKEDNPDILKEAREKIWAKCSGLSHEIKFAIDTENQQLLKDIVRREKENFDKAHVFESLEKALEKFEK